MASLQWNKRQHVLTVFQTVFSVTLSYFVLLSVMVSAFGGMLRQSAKSELQAATCSIPESLSTTLEITPNNSDNTIDCSGQDITITDSGKLVLKSAIQSDSSVTNDKGVVLLVRNLVVTAGGQITASGEGYAPGSADGNSATASTGTAAGSGGGYGGAGGTGNSAGGTENVVGLTGSVVGDREAPVLLGGAGGTSGTGGVGGKGGGAIKIFASGTVTVNGTVSADGQDGQKSEDNQTAGGGGAGGSIWIEANSLAGSGIVRANGGGTDNTAGYRGGGGGGGRIFMVCNASTTFSGTVSTNGGLGSQNGQTPSYVGPGCRPPAPSILRVFEKAGTGSVGREILLSELTTYTNLTFASDLNGSGLKLEVELKEKADTFQNVQTRTQIVVDSNKNCSGLPTSGTFSIGSYCGYVEIPDLASGKQYKWQARVVSNDGIGSTWVQFGNNPVTDEDFTIVGAPASLVVIEGNNQTATIGQILPVRPKVQLRDANGWGVPYYGGFGWAITGGGGVVSETQGTTDKWGYMTAQWKLGNIAGVGNNKLRAYKNNTSFVADFTASSTPDQVVKYIVRPAKQISVTNADFTYTVTAKDQFDNTVPVTQQLSVYPVSSNDSVTAGLGTLTPAQITISNGVATITTARYSYSESIKIKVVDSNGASGLSTAILFVDSLGSCPAITVDTDQTWDASTVPGGIFDCRGLGVLTIKTGFTLTLKSYNNGDSSWANDFGVTILADAMTIETGAFVSGNGSGYGANSGPGAGGYGAAYGGYGGEGNSTPYGDVYDPTLLGSGGGNGGGTGGGAVTLAIDGTLTVDGTLMVDGTNGWSDPAHCAGGGTGGSIKLRTTTLNGTGIVHANGGNGAGAYYNNAGGGSGGRVAVYYTNGDFGVDNADKLFARGGAGAPTGGAGTVYVEQSGVDVPGVGHLYIDNGSYTDREAALAPLNPETPFRFASVRLTRYGHLVVMGQTSLIEITTNEGVQGDTSKPRLVPMGTFSYLGPDPFMVNGYTLSIKGKVLGLHNIIIGNTLAGGIERYAKTWAYDKTTYPAWGDVLVDRYGTLVGYSEITNNSDWTDDYGVTIKAENLTIVNGGETGGIVSADYTGYGWVQGPGASGQSGATYGGFGRGSPQSPYGNPYEPVSLGSGGGGAGGGALTLDISGTLTNNGRISANGGNAYTNQVDAWGGGTGGSLYIKTSVFNGTGLVRSNGGDGAGAVHANQGAGSGGRIAVYYQSGDYPVTDKDYIFARSGVGGSGAGGAGTIYVEKTGVDTSHAGILLVDNNNVDSLDAALPTGTYQFKKIMVSRYGHLRVLGNDSFLIVTSAAGFAGDSTKPRITIDGTFEYRGTGALTVDGVDLGINGRMKGEGDSEITDVTIGETMNAGMTLYANTWWYNTTKTHVLNSLTVASHGTLKLVDYDNNDSNWTNDYGVSLTVNTLTVAEGGTIHSNYLGYAGGRGPGAGTGAAYGGYGGDTTGTAYGDVYEPKLLGSASSYGGAPGGGVVNITVNGVATINGTIAANGSEGYYVHDSNKGGGGSGGSILLKVDTLNTSSSTSVIQANGGRDFSGAYFQVGRGGGGGRIGIYYRTGNYPVTDPTRVQSFGAVSSGGQYGGAGTIYLEQTGVDAVHGGALRVDNGGHNAGYAVLIQNDYLFKSITLKNYGHLRLLGNDGTLTLTTSSGLQGDTTKPKITVDGTLIYTGTGALSVDGVDLGINGRMKGPGTAEVTDVVIGATQNAGMTLYAHTWWYNSTNKHILNSISVGNYGTLTLVPYDSNDSDWTNDYGVSLTLTNLTVAPSGIITSDSLGYNAGRGPGAGHAGAYGGYAGSTSGTPYGNVYTPTDLGSGGTFGGVAGGGVVNITVTNVADINGKITSNGQQGVYIGYDAKGSGGSGGSIVLNTKTLNGSSTSLIQANGGRDCPWGYWNHGNGGSGGRIAVYYQDGNYPLLSATNLQAYGGFSNAGIGAYGGAGTIYIEHVGVDPVHGATLKVDNNSNDTQDAILPKGNYNFAKIILEHKGNTRLLDSSSTLLLSASTAIQGDSTKSRLKIDGTFVYTGSGALAIDGIDLGINGRMKGEGDSEITDVVIGNSVAAGVTLYANTWWYNKTRTHVINSVTVGSHGTLTMVPYDSGDSDWTNDYGVSLTATNLTVDAGGSITSDYLGYSGGRGPGSYHAGGYGGYGGAETGVPYGDLYEPKSLGSSASFGGGAAGGVVNLTVLDTATINGSITSNGGQGNDVYYSQRGSGGSGGSILIKAKTINGSSTSLIQANGGRDLPWGYYWSGNGGGGGRIAVYYENGNYPLNDRTKIQAFGGVRSDGNYAGPGTLYLEHTGVDSAKQGSLILDNNDHGGRAQNIKAGTYVFNNVTIGKNVTTWVESDPTALLDTYTPPAPHEENKTDSSMALYNFNERGFVDSSSNKNDATPYGDVATVTGKFGLAKRFDRTQVAIPRPITPPDSYTIDLWAKFPLNSTSDGGWRSLVATRNGNYYHIMIDASGILGVYRAGWYPSGFSTASLTGWHHIASVASGTSTKFYVDGAYVGTSANKVTEEISMIGNYAPGGVYAPGILDAVRITSGVMSDSDIQAAATSTTAPIANTSTIALWQFDEVNKGLEDSSTVWSNASPNDVKTYSDSSGNGHNGTPTAQVGTVNGKFGLAKDFEVGQGITVPAVTLPASYTIDLWAKFPLPVNGSWRTILARNGGTYHHIIIHADGSLGVWNNGWAPSGFNVNTLTPGWHHIAQTATGNATRFYIDGNYVGTSATKVAAEISSVGNYTPGGGQWAGILDAIRVTNGVMSDSDIQAAAASTTAPVADASTLALWQFDELDNQLSTSKNYATSVNTTQVDGKFGKARQFGGSSSRLSFVNAMPAVPFEFTIDTWFKTTTTTGGTIASFANTRLDEPSNADRILFMDNEGKLNFDVYNPYNGGWSVVRSPANYNDGQWHYVAVTHDLSGVKLYVDSQKVAERSVASGYMYSGSAYLRAGYVYSLSGLPNQPTSPYFFGAIDEMRLSKVALTQQDISNAYNLGSALTPTDDTIGLWHFDETLDAIAADETGNYNVTDTTSQVVPAEGKFGEGRYFSGNGYYTLPSGFQDFSGGMTISLWAKPTAVTNYARFIEMNTGNSTFYFLRLGTTNDLYFGSVAPGAGSSVNIIASNALILNEWHHYAVTIKSDGDTTIYRDGKAIAWGTTPASQIPVARRTANYIGNSGYVGYMDDVQISNRALSLDEIRAAAAGFTYTEYVNYAPNIKGKGVTLKLKGNFLLDTGAKIMGTGAGFSYDEGLAAGKQGVGYSGGGGGANGGDGGRGQSDGQNAPADGGIKYGDQLEPFTLGSGGGTSGVHAVGGSGGGSIAIIAMGTLENGTYVNGNITTRGTINMDGTAGKTGSPGGGGGAGGSVLLHGNTCDIGGTISAKGGEGGNSDVDGGSGGGGRVSVLYNVGPCTVSAAVSVIEGRPTDAVNYNGQVGQIGTFPEAPNSVPWPSQYREQFELKETASQQKISSVNSTKSSVLGISESVIPVGGVINGTTVTLKADAYDSGARVVAPKRLKIQIELKKVGEAFNGTSGIYDSDIISFTGGAPAVLSVTINNLEMGTSYKWRVRTVNVDNNLISDWIDFGNNPETSPDFTITSVAALQLTVAKTPVDLMEQTSVTVTAKNAQGNTDTSYRGIVRFRSSSSSAQIPAQYTFVAGDNGRHTFTGVQFFESGTFTITAEDTVNTTLVDTTTVEVNAPRIPFLSIGASAAEIMKGDSVTLTWSSSYVSNLSIDNGVGAVSVSGSQVVTPTATTTYTITGRNEQGNTMTSSVTVTVTELPEVPVAAALKLEVQNTPILITDTTSVKVTIINDQGVTYTDYVGTVHFSSSSSTAQLPSDYTFTPEDRGVHMFTNIKFFEAGDFTISATDAVNSALTDTGSVRVNQVATPYLTLGASRLQITKGDSVTLTWSSGHVTNLSIDHGIGSVAASGNKEMTPTETTTYTITGQNEQGGTMTSAVTITVNDPIAAQLKLEVQKSPILITDTTSVKVTIINNRGATYTPYTGTIHFSSSSDTAQLPSDYTFTAEDRGVHVFSDIRFFETGDFVITAMDTVDTALVGTDSIRVNQVTVSLYLTIGASRLEIYRGQSTKLAWASHNITNLAINEGIGAVSAYGSRDVTPDKTTTYTISGRTASGLVRTSSVTITVKDMPSYSLLQINASPSHINKGESSTLSWTSNKMSKLLIDQGVGSVSVKGSTKVTPSRKTIYTITGTDEKGVRKEASTIVYVQTTINPPQSCPVIKNFDISDELVKKSNNFEISWKVENADTVSIDAVGTGLPLVGKVQLAFMKPQNITLVASKGACQRKATKHVEVVTIYPWEGAGGLLVSIVALETVAMQTGFSQGNMWFALLGLIDRTKKRRPWGIVYDSVTKKLIPRVIVRLWDSESGKLVDTVVTDVNGIFKLTPKKGKYVIKVVHANYSFPSELVAGDTDTGYTNVYKGEVIEVVNDNDQLMISIPMDPEKRSTQSVILRKVFSILENFVSVVSPVMLAVGFVYSVVVTIMYPLLFNFIVLFVYVLCLLVKLIVYFGSPRVFGMVTSVDGKLVSGLELGIYDPEFNTLVARTFTNKKGSYNFVAKNQDYLLRVLDTKYKLLHKGATKDGLLVPKNNSKSGVRLISENLMVYEAGIRKNLK